jgi:hypothetical protein
MHGQFFEKSNSTGIKMFALQRYMQSTLLL